MPRIEGIEGTALLSASGHTLFLGVDPGKQGGIAALWDTQAEVHRVPETEADLWDVFSQFSPEKTNLSTVGLIERVHSSPQMGVTSAFSFGRSYGFLRACLVAARIPFEEVTPHKWQKSLGIPPRKKPETQPQFKKRLKQKAQNLFPQIDITLATADAVLIAEYARRVHG